MKGEREESECEETEENKGNFKHCTRATPKPMPSFFLDTTAGMQIKHVYHTLQGFKHLHLFLHILTSTLYIVCPLLNQNLS
jgi:hypothetical protein